MARCHSPLYLPRHKGRPEALIPIPCGKCVYCKRRRVNSWVFRLLQEDKVSLSSYFVTLTYDRYTLPKSKKNRSTLVKKDLQKFFRKLRKLQPRDKPIKYYACGEYGTKNSRPHYHIILFNVLDTESIYKAWTRRCEIRGGERAYQMGKIDIGTVSGASIAYTAKYIDKKRRIPEYKGDDRVPEFSLMSKKLGINYITPQIIKYHKADLRRMYVTLKGGIKTAMPKYYRNLIFNEQERSQQRTVISQLEKQELADLRQEFAKMKNKPDISFETWLETHKHAQYVQFYHNHNTKRQ